MPTPTRELLLQILADGPLSANKIHRQVKKQFSLSITYQAVHKLLLQLETEGVLQKVGANWEFNQRWVQDQLLFFRKVHSRSKLNVKLFAFDVNGVLTPEMTHVEFAAKSPDYNQIKELITLQTLGKITIAEAFGKLANLFKGISLYDVIFYAQNFELMPGVEELTTKLKAEGATLGLITTGFKIPMQCLNKRLGEPFDFIICNEFVFSRDGIKLSFEEVKQLLSKSPEEQKKVVIEDIKLHISKSEMKTQLLKEHLKTIGLEMKDVCCVGDSMGDADFIKVASEEGIGVAFNPNLSLLEYAQYLKQQGNNVKIVRSKDLRDLLELFV